LHSLEAILVTTAVLLLLAILASKAAARLGVPALLLFLCLGMLAGSEGIGGIEFDYPRLAQSAGIVALAFILFAAALDTKWDQIRPVLGSGISLATLGVVISSVLIAWFATRFAGFSFPEGLLLGAVVSSTDAAAVFSVLRSKNLALKGRLREVAELESGSNDPMAVLLTIGMLAIVANPAKSIWSLVPLFLFQLSVGAVLGVLCGSMMLWLTNRIRLEWDGLYPVLSIALVLGVYGITTWAHGSGFLAIYIAGLVLGNATFIHRRTLMLFHDGLAWLMQIAMFIVLGLQVFPSRLIPVASFGLLASAFLMFVARPASVFSALSLSAFNWREKLFLSWAGLRGAAPIILATFPLVTGTTNAELFFNVVFFITLTSVLLQGTTISLVARWTEVLGCPGRKRAYPIEYSPAGGIKNELVEIDIGGDSEAAGKRIVELVLPKDVLIVLIGRGEELIVPSGSTEIMTGDTLLVLGEKEPITAMRAQLTSRKA
jgi:cell volume regulation protein A